MNVNNIPQDMLHDIRIKFEKTPEVMQLRTQQQYMQRTGNLAMGLELGQRIEGLFSVVLAQYIQQAEKEAKTFDTETSDIPQKDKDEMMEKLMALFIATDIIDTAIADLNDILHRTNPDVDITTFNDLKQISESAKKKLKYLQETGDYMKDLVWADSCDNMYEMICNKARSVIRKRKESKNWGENVKRL